MVKAKEGWTVVGLMDLLFGPTRLLPLAGEVAEARKRAEFLRDVPEAEAVRANLARLARVIVRDTDERHLGDEGDVAAELARVARRNPWDPATVARLADGYIELDEMVQHRVARLAALVHRQPARSAR